MQVFSSHTLVLTETTQKYIEEYEIEVPDPDCGIESTELMTKTQKNEHHSDLIECKTSLRKESDPKCEHTEQYCSSWLQPEQYEVVIPTGALVLQLFQSMDG